MVNVDKCVKVFKKRKYGWVEIDLWNNPEKAVNFSPRGAKLAYQIMKDVFDYSPSKNRYLVGSPGSKTCMFLFDVLIQEANKVADQLKFLLTDPSNTIEINYKD